MMKANVNAETKLVILEKNNIRMITSTPQGVWLYYKNSENGTLFTSSTLEPTELFKKVASAIACTPNELESSRKEYAQTAAAENNLQNECTPVLEAKISNKRLETVFRISKDFYVGRISWNLPTDNIDSSLIDASQIREIHSQFHECIYQAILSTASSEQGQAG
ncbi:hypothetical protein [Enterobacter asburiae]|uniref:hypothetical protein n=1 Tax=Enterobacter asburiae TaxID=61645 RepID=UPI0021D03A40|nr:hypothetical protein [Enterobacter asburiae]MCU6243872.1 hypothetical protein [Enterobacter asburiae]